MRGRFIFREDYTYRMPVHFSGRPFNNENRVVYSDVLTLKTEQKTEMEALAAYVPSEFEILRPSVIWQYMNCRGVDFMANGEYKIFQAGVPVKYTGGGEAITGAYPLVIFEDDPVPILGGREEDGMPKVFCNISPERHYENHWFASASLYCETMLSFDFHETGEASAEELKAAQDVPLVNSFGYRCIPNVGRGGSATRGPVLYPQEMRPAKMWKGEGGVKVTVPDAWYKNPPMYSILTGLNELPNLGFTAAERTHGTVRLCVADSKAL